MNALERIFGPLRLRTHSDVFDGLMPYFEKYLEEIQFKFFKREFAILTSIIDKDELELEAVKNADEERILQYSFDRHLKQRDTFLNYYNAIVEENLSIRESWDTLYNFIEKNETDVDLLEEFQAILFIDDGDYKDSVAFFKKNLSKKALLEEFIALSIGLNFITIIDVAHKPVSWIKKLNPENPTLRFYGSVDSEKKLKEMMTKEKYKEFKKLTGEPEILRAKAGEK